MRNENVSEAWARGEPATAGHFFTDGTKLYSYAHVIGITEGGKKVAYDCHYSRTTARHAGLGKRAADETRPCATCGEEVAHAAV